MSMFLTRKLRVAVGCGLVLGLLAMVAPANASEFSLNHAGSASVDQAQRMAPSQAGEDDYHTTDATYGWVRTWDLSGPYFLRSADPEEPGELEMKFIYGYETASSKSDDNSFEFELEWGMIENVELILSSEAVIGNGGIDGNGDITLGLHTRLWKENHWIPAFALRHLVRFPTGYQSAGVDYMARGMLTKTIIPGQLRAHLNPYIKVVSGDNETDQERDFQWGTAIGVDYRFNEDLLFVADYQIRAGEERGQRDNHSLELGVDWDIAEHQMLAFSTEFGLDGDEYGPNWGCHISYIISLDTPLLEK